MIDAERDAVVAQFGVAVEQVERDHLVSYLLAAIAAGVGDDVHLIGGTALARTYLPGGRLSEDIDLVALGPRKPIAAKIDALLPRAVARTHGRLSWDPALSDIRDTEAARLVNPAGLSVKIQLLSARDRIVWPSELRHLEQRYSDAPEAALRVPTLPAFAASKTSTWNDRQAPRDLWDLWALNRIGAINHDAARLYKRYGPTNCLPEDYLFRTPPSEAEWRSQLAGQTTLTVTASTALSAVALAWKRLGEQLDEE